MELRLVLLGWAYCVLAASAHSATSSEMLPESGFPNALSLSSTLHVTEVEPQWEGLVTDTLPAVAPIVDTSNHDGLAADLRAPNTTSLTTSDSLLIDAMGQVYRWRADQSLEKVRAANVLAGLDTLRYRYRNVRLGKLHSIDLTNPLRPVLFYQDAQTVVWLHRNMTELRQLNLLDAGLSAVDAVAYAPSEGLWLYAADRQQLLQLDRDGAVRYASAELSQTFNQPIRASQLAASSTQVSLASDDGRLLLFGPFGGYRTQILQPVDYLVANGDRLVYRSRGQFYRYSGSGLPIDEITVPSDLRLLGIGGDYALWLDRNRSWKVEQLSQRP